MVAISLALGASLAWGLSDFVAGVKSRQMAVVWVLLVSQATGLVLVTTAALDRRRPAAEPAVDRCGRAAPASPSWSASPRFYRALAIGAMAVVAPISATAAVVPLFVGVVGGEAPTDRAGARDGAGARRRRARVGRGRPPHGAGVGLAIVAALAFGVFFVGMDIAADDGALWAVVLHPHGPGRRVVTIDPRAPPPVPDRPPGDRPARRVGALDIAANVMFATALTLGMAAHRLRARLALPARHGHARPRGPARARERHPAHRRRRRTRRDRLVTA